MRIDEQHVKGVVVLPLGHVLGVSMYLVWKDDKQIVGLKRVVVKVYRGGGSARFHVYHLNVIVKMRGYVYRPIEIGTRVRKIEIKTRGLSNQIFAGKYHSAFKGRGMAFSEVREYRTGDDVRDIDWNVTARNRSPYVKIFEEERELTLMLVVDVSGSRMFGSADKLKKNIITEIAAVLAFSASENNDKIGCIFFSDKIEKFIPPKKGRSHVLMIIRELIDFKPESQGTDIAQAVRFLTGAISAGILRVLPYAHISVPTDMCK